MSSLFMVTQTCGWASAASAAASQQASAAMRAMRKRRVIVSSVRNGAAPYHSVRRKRGASCFTSPEGREKRAPQFRPSHPLNAAVGARIVRAFEHSVGMNHDGTGVAHEVRIGFIQQFHIMARSCELFDEARRKPRLEP